MPTLPEIIQEVGAATASGNQDRIDSALGELHLALRVELPSDPLLAASSLVHVTEPELLEALEKVASQMEPRVGRANALVVTPEGRGHCVEIVVDLVPGNTGVWCPHELSRDAHLAAQLAAAVALGQEQGQWGVRWQIRGGAMGATTRLRGSSLGLAVAVAVRAALTGRSAPSHWSFSAGLDLDGQLVEVSGLPAKIRAADAAGHRDVVLPLASASGLGAPDGIRLRPHAHFEAVSEELWPQRRGRSRTVSWKWGLLLLPMVMAWTSLLDGVDLFVRGPLMRQVLGELPAENAVVLALPEGDRKALRWDYPDQIRRLVDAEVTAIGFDVLFLSDSDADTLFVEAIEEAANSGVSVVLPQRFDGHDFLPRGKAFRTLEPSATVLVEEDMLFGAVRRLPVRVVDAQGTVRWSLSAALLSAHLRTAPPRLDGGVLSVGVTRNKTQSDRMILPPVERPERLGWEESFEEGSLRGKAVFIGVMDGPSDALRTSSGVRYGVEIHAAAFETLARQRGLRSPGPVWNAMTAFVVGLVSAFVARRKRNRGRYMVFGVGALALVGVAAALQVGLVFALAPALVAHFLGIWVGRRV